MAAPGSGVPRPCSPARTDLPTCIPGVQGPGGAGPRVLPGQARPAMGKRPQQRRAQGIPRVAALGRAARPAALSARTTEPGPGRLWPSFTETKGGGASAENLISLLGR